MTAIRKIGSVCGVMTMKTSSHIPHSFTVLQRANDVLTVTMTVPPDVVNAARRNFLTRTTSLLLSPTAIG